MWKKLFGARRKPALVKGTSRLAEGHAKKVDVGDVMAGTGVSIVFCRIGGRLYALDAVCPHEGGRIAEGELVDGRYAICPLHRYKFDPATGNPIEVSCARARTYKVREQDDEAEVWI